MRPEPTFASTPEVAEQPSAAQYLGFELDASIVLPQVRNRDVVALDDALRDLTGSTSSRAAWWSCGSPTVWRLQRLPRF